MRFARESEARARGFKVFDMIVKFPVIVKHEEL